jgi:hypothetical protein
MMILLMSCGNKTMVVGYDIYNCYGFMDKSEEKKDNVVYKISTTNMLGTFILSESIIIPIWNLGWNTYCPVKILEKK